MSDSESRKGSSAGLLLGLTAIPLAHDFNWKLKLKQKRIQKDLFIVCLILAVLGSMVLVVASPLALNALLSLESNWALLSNVGQTYGAISALLTAVGLSGVAVSIAIQVRESRRSRLDSIRARHYELYKSTIDDPDLSETSYDSIGISSLKERKKMVFINLQLQFWLMLWEIDAMPESSLRCHAANVFKTASGSAYWRRFGPTPVATGGRREAKFYHIVNEEYQRVAAAMPDQGRYAEALNSTRRIKTVATVAMLVGVATGMALGRSFITRAIRINSNDS